jgi:hypothetical protein
MAAVTAFRLPGVYFLPSARPTPAALPPLDVTGFVGFATRGPLDTPVPVQDLATFDAVFGGPFALARDASGKPVSAYLRDAVATFFSSGGRRAYAVRVAGPAASPANFAVPGIIAFDAFGDPVRAEIAASSPGVWGEALLLGAQLEVTPVPPAAFTVAGPASLAWATTGAPNAVQPGDVLRVVCNDGSTYLFPVATVAPPGAADVMQVVVGAERVWAVTTTARPSLLGPIAVVSRLTAGGLVALPAGTLAQNSGSIGIWLAHPETVSLAVGELLILDFADGSRYAATVADLQVAAAMGGNPGPFLAVSASELLTLRDASGLPPALPPASAGIARIERLQLGLALKYGDASEREITGLGFNAAHPRFWGDIAVAESGSLAGGAGGSSSAAQQQQANVLAPGDATKFYGDLFGAIRADLDWTDPRLMTVLSTLLQPAPGDTMLYLPVGMPAILTGTDLVRPDPDTAQDDLAKFTASPFLDPNLAGGLGFLPAGGAATPATLLAAATDLYFLQDIKLKGVHSLMFLDEVALIGAPDAIQLGWAPQVPLALPPTATPPAPPAPALFTDCRPAPSLLSVDPASGSIGGGTPVTLSGEGFATDVTVTFGSRPATAVSVTDDRTLSCTSPPGPSTGPVTVTVTNATGSSSLAGAFTYRADQAGAVPPTVLDPSAYAAATLPELYLIQTALIGLCEARSDAVAILCLPLHFELQDCVAWLQGLRQGLGLPRAGFSYDDARPIADLSYAAVYHPWLLVPDPAGSSGNLRPVPPDGAACGAIAARELDRGVWIAPANDPLPGVLDLQPGFSDDDWAVLFAIGFNLARAEPRDFRFMSAHTLANDQRLLQLSVRRLMIQLRKAAAERGQDYVFARNDDLLRRRLQVQLEGLLDMMFNGGAFAGATRDAAYRITIDDTVNTPADAEQGRVVAQILVAPSQPMEFLTVLLTRNGDGQLQSTEG